MEAKSNIETCKFLQQLLKKSNSVKDVRVQVVSPKITEEAKKDGRVEMVHNKTKEFLKKI